MESEGVGQRKRTLEGVLREEERGAAEAAPLYIFASAFVRPQPRATRIMAATFSSLALSGTSHLHVLTFEKTCACFIPAVRAMHVMRVERPVPRRPAAVQV